MSSSNAAPAPSSKILSSDGTYVSGVVTDQALTKDFRITASGSRSLRADIYVGKVVATGSVTGKLAHSSGYNIWSNTNTVTITASTDKTISSVDTSANTLTSTTHGFVEDQAVVLYSSGETPAPIKPNLIYYVQKVDANTIKLKESIGGPAIDITAAGSGTITTCAARCFSITMQETVSGDQSYTPLKALGRVVVTTTNSADRCQVADVVILLGE
jgi:hypothetical protein